MELKLNTSSESEPSRSGRRRKALARFNAGACIVMGWGMSKLHLVFGGRVKDPRTLDFDETTIEVVGILNGYSHLLEFSESHPLEESRDYVMIDQKVLRRTRNSRGILLGTARANQKSEDAPSSRVTR